MRVARWLERHLEEAVCCVALSAVATLVFLQVIMRYVFDTALQWSSELAAIAMVWAVYMGAALCVRERFHIRIMAGVTALPTALGKPVVFLADALCMAFAVLMLVVGVEYLGVLAQYPSRTPRLGIDELWPQSIVVVGYALILARLVQVYVLWWRDGREGLPGMRVEEDLDAAPRGAPAKDGAETAGEL